MKKSRLLKTLVIVLVATAVSLFSGSAFPGSAWAQQRYRSPSRPTLSSYLDYFCRDNGALGDPYNAWVRPRADLRQTLVQQQQGINNLRQDVRQVDTNLDRVRDSVAAPTGTGAGFMNYSHYYRLNPVRRR